MRKTIGRRGLTLLLWGLAFHIVVIALLYGAVGIAEEPLRLLAAWKEVVVGLLLVYVCLRSPFGLGPRALLCGTDMVVFAFVTLSLIFLIGGSTVVDGGLPFKAQLLGFRDAIFFLALYVVGRATPEVLDDPRLMRQVIAVGVVTSLIAVVEIAFVTPDLLAAVGVGAYFNDFLDISATTSENEYGLPDNYWSIIGGHLVRRAGSTYLTSQGFAIPFLVILAVGTWRVFADERRPGARAWVAYAILWIGLLLSITRMTIAACGLQILAALALRKRAGALLATVAAGVLVVTAAGVVVPSVGSFIWQTVTGQTGSNQSHAKDIAHGLEAVGDRPWGSGLGTADQTALRNGLKPLTFDNMYLKYATELGVAGAALFVAILVSILVQARALALRGDTVHQRRAGGVVFLASIGILVNGMTSDVFNSPWLAYVFCWLAGAVVTAGQPATAPLPSLVWRRETRHA